MDPDTACHFDKDPDPAFRFYTDPDPYHFKEVMYLKQYRYFVYILTLFSLSIGPTGPNQKAYFVKFSLPVNFVVLIRVAYACESGS